jgi:hypothetical protein
MEEFQGSWVRVEIRTNQIGAWNIEKLQIYETLIHGLAPYDFKLHKVKESLLSSLLCICIPAERWYTIFYERLTLKTTLSKNIIMHQHEKKYNSIQLPLCFNM